MADGCLARGMPTDLELVLEPNANPAAKQYQEAIFKQGIPITAFEVDDIKAEYETTQGLGRDVYDGAHRRGPGNDRYFFGHVRESHPAISAWLGLGCFFSLNFVPFRIQRTLQKREALGCDAKRQALRKVTSA